MQHFFVAGFFPISPMYELNDKGRRIYRCLCFMCTKPTSKHLLQPQFTINQFFLWRKVKNIQIIIQKVINHRNYKQIFDKFWMRSNTEKKHSEIEMVNYRWNAANIAQFAHLLSIVLYSNVNCTVSVVLNHLLNVEYKTNHLFVWCDVLPATHRMSLVTFRYACVGCAVHSQQILLYALSLFHVNSMHIYFPDTR